jgi:TIR domain
MDEIFISYAHEDKQKAGALATILFNEGWTVFWDQYIPTGATWDNHLMQEVLTCDCVVVLWSAASVRSSWVRLEALAGLKRKILVPAQLDWSEPPPEFRRVQAAQLQEWSGEAVSAPLFSLMMSITNLAGSSAPSVLFDNPQPDSVANDKKVCALYKGVWLLFNCPFEPMYFATLANTVATELEKGGPRPDKKLRNLHRLIQAYFNRLSPDLSFPMKASAAMKARFLACTTPADFYALVDQLNVEFPPSPEANWTL